MLGRGFQGIRQTAYFIPLRCPLDPLNTYVSCGELGKARQIFRSYAVTVKAILTGAEAPSRTPRSLGEQPPTVTRNSPGSRTRSPASLTNFIISGVTVNVMTVRSPDLRWTRWKPIRLCRGTTVDASRSLR